MKILILNIDNYSPEKGDANYTKIGGDYYVVPAGYRVMSVNVYQHLKQCIISITKA